MNIPLSKQEVILSVDEHLYIHIRVLISNTGKLLGELPTEINTVGYQKLLKCAQSFGQLNRAGIEGTGTYGTGLTRVLREHGVSVYEVNRPDRSRRRLQKSMQRMRLAQSWQVGRLQFPKNSQVWLRLCVSSVWHAEVPLKLKHKRSTS